jgi:hypothetical protein
MPTAMMAAQRALPQGQGQAAVAGQSEVHKTTTTSAAGNRRGSHSGMDELE